MAKEHFTWDTRYDELSIGDLFKMIEYIAEEDWDGHYTIFKFTTNFRGCFGSVNTINDINKFPPFDDLRTLLLYMITKQPRFDDLLYNNINDDHFIRELNPDVIGVWID